MQKNNSIFGYDSFSDFLTTIFGYSYSFKFNSFIAALTSISSFITGYIYDDYKAVYFLLFLILLDFISGTAKAIKLKTFSSKRLPRILLTIISYCILLSVSWNAAKYNDLFFFLPSLIYGGLTGTLLISVFENFYFLGYLPQSIYLILKQRLKLEKLFDKTDSDNPK